MTGAFRALGAMTAAAAGFVGVFAVAFAITRGSAWMLAFFPLFFAVPGTALIVILRPMLQDPP